MDQVIVDGEDDGFVHVVERPFSVADKKALMDIVKREAPELLQPSAIRRINRDIWEKMLVKFNVDTNREWSIRQIKSCLQLIVRKNMHRRGTSQVQTLFSRRATVLRFTGGEKRLLTNLVKNHLVLFSKHKDSDTIIAKRKAWTSVMWAFNKSPGIEGQRTAREIKTCIMNMLNRAKTRDVMELKALIASQNNSNLPQTNPTTQVQIVSIQEDQQTPAFRRRPGRPSLKNSQTPMMGSNKYLLPKPSLLQTSHPPTQILISPMHSSMPQPTAVLQKTCNQALAGPIQIPPPAVPFPLSGEPQLLNVQAPFPQQVHHSSDLYPHTSTAMQGHYIASSAIQQNPDGNVGEHSRAEKTSAFAREGNFNTSPETLDQIIEIKDEVETDDSDNDIDVHQQIIAMEEGDREEATNTESENIIQLEKVRNEGPAFTDPGSATQQAGENSGLSNIHMTVHEQDQDHSEQPLNAELGESSYLQTVQSPENLTNQISECLRGRDDTYSNEGGVIERRPIGILGPRRTTGRSGLERSLQQRFRNQPSSSPFQEVDRDDDCGMMMESTKESLGKMKRRLLQEEHDLKIAHMREEHTWHLKEHQWKQEEHELRMSMIRINAKI